MLSSNRVFLLCSGPCPVPYTAFDEVPHMKGKGKDTATAKQPITVAYTHDHPQRFDLD